MQRRDWLEQHRARVLEQPSIGIEIDKGKLQDFVLRMVGFLEESNIVADFGCRSADFWPLLRDMKLRVVGVSCNQAVRQSMGIRVMNVSLSDFNFLGIFDGFIASGMLQRLHPELWSKTLLRIARSVKTSGVGLIVTGISEEEVRQYYINQVPMKRGCTYQDVCNVLVFLASDQSSYMTGQAINVTGGQEMR